MAFDVEISSTLRHAIQTYNLRELVCVYIYIYKVEINNIIYICDFDPN